MTQRALSSVYRTRWSRGCAVASAGGVGFSFLLWSPQDTGTALAITTFVAGVLLVLGSPLDHSHRLRWGTLATVALNVGAGMVTAVAVMALLQVTGVLVVLLVAVTSPWARSWWARRSRRSAEVAESDDDVVPPQTWLGADTASFVRRLSDRELCEAFRHTYPALLNAQSPTVKAQIVSLRQLYLDDLERRDPLALAAWLASGATAGGSPDRFIS
jgi:hypothetical protein